MTTENPVTEVERVPGALGVWSKIRENVEAVLVAIILALIIRHFSLEAFEIPTGSMAPGLHGVHVETQCPNCETVDNIGVDTHSQSGKLDVRKFGPGWIYEGACGNCRFEFESNAGRNPNALDHERKLNCPFCDAGRAGSNSGFRWSNAMRFFTVTCRECRIEYREVVEPGDAIGGHKILVNKFLYECREPERWEVIVFKFNRQRNYIKRLIGLPNERLDIRDGDIYINNEIARKPMHVQDEMWFPVHDSDVIEKWDKSPWNLDRGNNGVWSRPESGGFKFDASRDGGKIAYERAIRNHYTYNVRNKSDDGRAPINDLRVVVNARVDSGSGDLRLIVHNSMRIEFRCILPVGTGKKATFEGRYGNNDAPETLSEFDAPLALGTETKLDFYVADRHLVLRIDGELVHEWPMSDDWNDNKKTGTKKVSLHALGVTGELSRVQIFRDIHYTNGTGNYESEVMLGDDEFFVLGDNSPSSQDSRKWGTLKRQNLLGRAFAIFWPAHPGRFEMGFIR